MSDIKPIHVDNESAAAVYKQLDQQAEAGTLASSREYLTEEEAAKLEAEAPKFEEKSDEDIAKMKKEDILAYFKAKAAHDAAAANRRLVEEVEGAKQAAIHGFKRQPKGEMLATGFKRGVPTPLKDDEGAPRKNKKGGIVTRTDW